MEHDTPFDGQQLLDSLRELNRWAREMTFEVSDYVSKDFKKAADTVSDTTTHAAQEAEAALKAMEAGDPMPAQRYLDRMAYVMGMVSLATQEA